MAATDEAHIRDVLRLHNKAIRSLRYLVIAGDGMEYERRKAYEEETSNLLDDAAQKIHAIRVKGDAARKRKEAADAADPADR